MLVVTRRSEDITGWFILFAVFATVFTIAMVMLSWNSFVSPVFGLARIDFLQALAFAFLLLLLRGGTYGFEGNKSQ